MISIEKSVLIERSPEAVFAFVTDQTNGPRWQRGLLDARRTTSGPIGVGTRHTFVRSVMGRRVAGSNEYTRYDPHRFVAFTAASSSMGLQASYTVEPVSADRSRLTSKMEMHLAGVSRLVGPLIGRTIRKEVEANLSALKTLLESEAR